MDSGYDTLHLSFRYESFIAVYIPKEAVDRLHFIMVKFRFCREHLGSLQETDFPSSARSVRDLVTGQALRLS